MTLPYNSTKGVFDILVTLNQTNTTTTTLGAAVWTVSAICSLTFLITGLPTNGVLLLLFLRDHRLFTSFNVYVFNLCIVNLQNCLIQYPLDLIQNLYNLYAAWPLGDALCKLYLYAVWHTTSVMSSAHLLIAFNRLWAVGAPVSYRKYHSQRMAAVVYCLTWLIPYAILPPLLLVDGFKNRLSLSTNGCHINSYAQYTYSVAVVFFVYDFLTVGASVALPVLMVMKRGYGRKPDRAIAPAALPVAQDEAGKPDGVHLLAVTYNRPFGTTRPLWPVAPKVRPLGLPVPQVYVR